MRTDGKIELDALKPGYLYRLHSRNLSMGVWNPTLQSKGGFIGIRTKFESRFLDVELHFDSDPRFGTAVPLEILAECPVPDQRLHLGTICGRCDQEFGISIPVEFLPYADGPRYKTYKSRQGDGTYKEWTNEYKSGWQHTADGGKCSEPFGRSVGNTRLFEWLDQAEKDFAKPEDGQ
jgi:hypothetical protein